MPDATPVPAPEHAERVRALLAAAGLNPPEAEVAALAAAYPQFWAMADRLYPLVYDDDPAPVFDPVALFGAGSGA